MSNEKLKERLALRGKHKDLVNKKQALSDKIKDEGRSDFTDDEKREWEDLTKEIKVSSSYFERQEEIDAVNNEHSNVISELGMLFNRNDAPAPKTRSQYFAELGEKINSAFDEVLGSGKHRAVGISPEIRATILSTESGTDGGYLVPNQYSSNIGMVPHSPSIIEPRALVIAPGNPPDSIWKMPYWDQSSSINGGITNAYKQETGSLTASSAEFGELMLEPKAIGTYQDVTKQMLRNSDSLGSFLAQTLGVTWEAKKDYLFMRGTGLNQPKGILNEDCMLKSTRTTALRFKYADATAMMDNQLDDNGAIWVASKKLKGEFTKLEDGAGNAVFIAGDAARGIPDTLFGFPIYFTPRLPSLGTNGDVMFINPRYYVIKQGSPFEILTYDVNPTTQKIDIVGIGNYDGGSWLKGAVVDEDGQSYSPFCSLTTKLT